MKKPRTEVYWFSSEHSEVANLSGNACLSSADISLPYTFIKLEMYHFYLLCSKNGKFSNPIKITSGHVFCTSNSSFMGLTDLRSKAQNKMHCFSRLQNPTKAFF